MPSTVGFSLVATEAVRQEFIYNAVGGGSFAGVNAAVIWALVVLLVFHLAVFNTPVGKRILAIGGDAVSSFSREVRFAKIKLGVFRASGLLAAFAAVLDVAFIGYADGSFGATIEI